MAVATFLGYDYVMQNGVNKYQVWMSMLSPQKAHDSENLTKTTPTDLINKGEGDTLQAAIMQTMKPLGRSPMF